MSRRGKGWRKRERVSKKWHVLLENIKMHEKQNLEETKTCIYEIWTAVPKDADMESKNEIPLQGHSRKCNSYFIKRKNNKSRK